MNTEPVAALAPSQHTSREPEQIRLRVGEKLFVTTRETLTAESAFFASLLSDRWDAEPEDGVYFVDADPVLFEHILRYLRSLRFPVFYDEGRGHDYGLYLALLGQAQYFGISRLEKWLEEKRFASAVQVRRTFEVHHDWEPTDVSSSYSNTNVAMEYYPSEEIKKTYVCPRAISVHDSAGKCGRLCRNARGDNEDTYMEETVTRMVIVTKEILIRPDGCIAQDV